MALQEGQRVVVKFGCLRGLQGTITAIYNNGYGPTITVKLDNGAGTIGNAGDFAALGEKED